MIAYALRQLKLHETRYHTHDLELGEVVFALKIWRHYLYGVCCTIYTDHKSLRHIMDRPNLNMRHRRWLDVDKDYDYEILYHPGKVNMVADALSCKSAGSSTPVTCMRISVDSPLVSLIREAQVEGKKCLFDLCGDIFIYKFFKDENYGKKLLVIINQETLN